MIGALIVQATQFLMHRIDTDLAVILNELQQPGFFSMLFLLDELEILVEHA